MIAQTDFLDINALVLSVGVPATIALVGMVIFFYFARREFESVKVEAIEAKARAESQQTVNSLVVNTQQQVGSLHDKMSILQQKIADEAVKSAKLEGIVQLQERDLNDLKRMLAERDKVIAERDNAIKDRDNTIAKLKADLDIITEQRDNLIKQREELTRKINNLTDEIARLNARLDMALAVERKAPTVPIPDSALDQLADNVEPEKQDTTRKQIPVKNSEEESSDDTNDTKDKIA